MKVFVTGVSGTIGRGVVGALRAAGHEISGLTSKEAHRATLEQQGVKVVVGDMQDGSSWKAEVAAADAVIHLAQASGPRVTKAVAKLSADADDKAVDILLSSISGRCQSLIYTSGVWAYGDSPAPADENTPARPFPLVAYKALGERKILDAAKAGKAPGIVLRPGVVYAPWGIFESAYLKAMKKGGSAKYPGTGDNVVSWLHIDDCAAGYLAAIERPVVGEIFNLCDDEPVAVKTMIGEVARLMGAKPPGGVPGFIIKLVVGGLLGEPLLANAAMTASKAKKQLGFAPRHPTYREGAAAIAATARSGVAPARA